MKIMDLADGLATRSKLAFQGVLKRFGGAGTVTGVRLAHESAKENSILDRELMDMRAAKGRGSVGASAFSGACRAVTFRSFSNP
jgi:hypothetical protein